VNPPSGACLGVSEAVRHSSGLADEGTPRDPVRRSSVDGTNWVRTPHDQAVLGNADMIDVIAAGPGLIAVGSYDPREAASVSAAVWVSGG